MEQLSGRSTRQVLEHHLLHNQNANLEEVLCDYCEDSVILTQDGIVKGLTQIRQFFMESMNEVFPVPSSWKTVCIQVEGELAYVVWTAESQFYEAKFGTDTFYIKNGRIKYQSFAGIIHKK